ncbi:nicotinamide riboside transporter PnuC [Yeosuana sp. AK3]|nr:nicotinamide mononucleotide transporter [Flavobacteriia bacterium]NCP05504.1 nicotinamide mononucleotide transporter [Flavobacteriales bacterium]PIV92403.1 MAG: nicotinamide mononucleotide transporter [Flavobacteriaceae bacterium CG17_big_fil_post_rev_8_21_14_2_50_33_15]PIY11801.1 MAG: nicotinamide mononucleotide transporter [Flavobacteriaceae bacterium CG_4_10_14_3_um_filter_33_47]PJB16754.1 MAG: nicotinamide mononucleotide transporter [Flavobacteriaceae bacterium CG_4_9_14_3_um_filter_33_1
MNQVFDFFIEAYKGAPTHHIILEAIAFVFGILSVWYAKKEDILVYPTGIICTVITVYLLYINQYFGDMMMNFYYSIMSVYGWWNWSRKRENKFIVPISRTTLKEKQIGILLFIVTMIVTYFVYLAFNYTLEIPNYIDMVTSGIFFTAMWYMANKKLENWTLWIIADIVTIPLYAYRGLGMLSLQYVIFTILAIQGYNTWKKRLNSSRQTV